MRSRNGQRDYRDHADWYHSLALATGFGKHMLAATAQEYPTFINNRLNNSPFCATVVRVKNNTRTYKKATASAELRRWFFDTVHTLWPVADGSLSLRKSSCVRPNCQACASGEGHRSYVLYGRGKKKRFSIYVPDELVPAIENALENGRLLKNLMSEAGVRYTHELKDKRQSRLSQEPKE